MARQEMIMRQTLVAFAITLALAASAAAPAIAAEFRKLPDQGGPADAQLRSTPDINNGNGGVNTDPAMTYSTGRNGVTTSPTVDGDACRDGAQSYPNANTDNPPGLQACPQ
jgi:hypothetical protein